MKNHHHFETYKPEPKISAFMAAALIGAAAGVATVLILATAGILV